MEEKLTQDQSVMKETARLFAVKTLSPVAGQYDELNAPFPEDWLRRANEMGFMNMLAPPELGGTGLKTFDAGLVLEELASGCAGMAAQVVASLAGILMAVNSEVDSGTLARFIKEPYEADSGRFVVSSAGMFQTPFSVSPDGTLRGSDPGVLCAGYARWYAVAAAEGDGRTCWIVPADSEGMEANHMKNPLGLRAAAPGRLKLEGVEGVRLGEVDSMKVLALVSTLMGCVAVGCAAAALEEARKYANERYQGGTYIINHDTIAHMILSNRARVDAARSRLREVMKENDELIDPESGKLTGKPGIRASLLARVFAADAAMQAATDAVQCFGGYGYMHDYPVEKRMRDVRSLGVIFGTNPDIMTYLKSSLVD